MFESTWLLRNASRKGIEMECKHATNGYIELDAPIVMHPDGSVKHITYRCYKCNKQVYRPRPWENYVEVE